MTPEHSNVLEFFLSLMFKHFPALVTILEIFNSKYGCIFSILKFRQIIVTVPELFQRCLERIGEKQKAMRKVSDAQASSRLNPGKGTSMHKGTILFPDCS